MTAGLGGGGAVFVAFETTMGTYVPPTGTGVWVPILSEDLAYNEDKYYSPQIRQATVVSDVQQNFYSVSGSINMEHDPNFALYFAYAMRHTVVKAGAGPFTYDFIPSSAGAASTAAGPTTPKTLSITVIRNGIGFGYAGCAVNTLEETIDEGVLKWNMGIIGLSETQPGGLGTPAWVAPILFGAGTHSIFKDASGTAPAFASPFETNFNGWTFRIDNNAEPQNRIRPDRSASYVSYGEGVYNYETELDFESRTDYDAMVANTTRAIRRESLKGGATYALATTASRTTIYRTSFENYTQNLSGLGDLIMANVSGRAIGIAGGNPYKIEIKSAVAIT